MLSELHVAELGVIDDVTVRLGPGLTALTGETGAGKTLLVDAIALLLGGRADPVLVRPGAAEAVVEGRFEGADGDHREVIVARVVPASGRARAYVDGRMAGALQLADTGAALVDLHGQHAHQSLLRPGGQRVGLDRYAGLTTEEVDRCRRRLKELTSAQEALGGDGRARARELDLLRFQLAELDGAAIASPDEDDDLQEEEARLGDAASLRQAAGSAAEGLAGDDGLVDGLGGIVSGLGAAGPLRELHDRLAGLQAELADAASSARAWAEQLEDDPARLAEIGARRHVLTDLRRKYGDTLAEVLAFRDAARARLDELEDHDRLAATLDAEIAEAAASLAAAEARLGAARRAAAPGMSAEVEGRLHELAMPRARFEVVVGDDRPGDDVTWLLSANPGEPPLPLTKVASGGELARAMLAARLCLTRTGGPGSSAGGKAGSPAGGESSEKVPPTLVFDEVDAGIGGEAAVAVGRALAALAAGHQVLVVTHLPQVAAFADRHLVVRKEVVGERTVATVREVDGRDRVVELSRMLSGRPDSPTARRHAEELLASRPSPKKVARRR
jgi:DNA repair protein RecN (Recombination protein N)